ncbi:MAG: EMC3/TMCO1 family protein [Candidatus Pacearchaeota archaeon]
MFEQLTNLATNYPRASVILISLVVSFISMLITKGMTDQALMKSIKERQKEIQKELKEKKYSPQDKQFLKLQKEMLELSATMIRHSFKPLLVTLVPFLILFAFLRNFYIPLIGNSWIWYYIVPSILISPLYKKILKMA